MFQQLACFDQQPFLTLLEQEIAWCQKAFVTPCCRSEGAAEDAYNEQELSHEDDAYEGGDDVIRFVARLLHDM